jgi:glycosyltransferase involved in cell wall biosynthesis
MIIAHLTASTFFGGPERQMLGLAQELAPEHDSVFMSFAEHGGCEAFLGMARRHRFEAIRVAHDTPYLRAATLDVEHQLRRLRADVLCCHGYKADLLGRWAARRQHIPVVAISRGWTGEDVKVRLYEALDRALLRRMDRVVCVSHAQALRVRRSGVAPDRIVVIHNAIRTERFEQPDPVYRQVLHAMLPKPCRHIIGAAGRLSPGKGFALLIRAAQDLAGAHPDVGFVVFGEGVLRQRLAREIDAAGLAGNFVLAGFRDDLDRFLPFLDLFVLPSFSEGLPNVVLEALAAGVAVVATAVGGTPEVVQDGSTGYLVAPGDARALADRIGRLLFATAERQGMGRRGRAWVHDHFGFAAQGTRYLDLFQQLGCVRGRSTAPRQRRSLVTLT